MQNNFFLILLGACTDGAARLVGSVKEYEGIVMICFNETWSILCAGSDNKWNMDTATIICRSMNFTGSGSKH